MTHDPELIEAVARAIAIADGWGVGQKHDGNDWRLVPMPTYRILHDQATAAIAAINASGTHWVAPASLTNEQADLALSVTASHLDIKGSGLTVNREKMKLRFMRLRERYLAKQEEPIS